MNEYWIPELQTVVLEENIFGKRHAGKNFFELQIRSQQISPEKHKTANRGISKKSI